MTLLLAKLWSKAHSYLHSSLFSYDLPSICDAAQECVRALLGDPIAPISSAELSRPPCPAAQETLHNTISIQQTHWPVLTRFAHTIAAPHTETDETCTRMAGLSMHPPPPFIR